MSNFLSGLKASVDGRRVRTIGLTAVGKASSSPRESQRGGWSGLFHLVPPQRGRMDGKVLVRRGRFLSSVTLHVCHLILHFPGMRNIKVLKAKGWCGTQEG